MQDHPHIARLVEINHGQARWFIEGEPAKLNMIDESLRESGLISFEQDGTIAVTPFGLDLLFKLP